MKRLQFLCTRVEFLCGEIAVLKFRGILPEKIKQREEELTKWMKCLDEDYRDIQMRKKAKIPDCVYRAYFYYLLAQLGEDNIRG